MANIERSMVPRCESRSEINPDKNMVIAKPGLIKIKKLDAVAWEICRSLSIDMSKGDSISLDKRLKNAMPA